MLGRDTVANTGASTFGGDVGTDVGGVITGVTAAMLRPGSARHEGDAVAAQAYRDLVAAYTALAARAYPAANTNPVLDGSLASGVYCFSGDAVLNTTHTLSGGGPWIFQVDGLLTVRPGATEVAPVVAPNTCGGRRVFWQVGDDDPATAVTPATIGARSTFVGNILALGDVTFNHVVAPNFHINGPVTDVAVVALNTDGTPKTARLSGTCNGFLPTCTFSILTEDNGEPAVDDRFGITVVSNGQVVEARSVNAPTVRAGQTMRLSVPLRRDRTATSRRRVCGAAGARRPDLLVDAGGLGTRARAARAQLRTCGFRWRDSAGAGAGGHAPGRLQMDLCPHRGRHAQSAHRLLREKRHHRAVASAGRMIATGAPPNRTCLSHRPGRRTCPLRPRPWLR